MNQPIHPPYSLHQGPPSNVGTMNGFSSQSERMPHTSNVHGLLQTSAGTSYSTAKFAAPGQFSSPPNFEMGQMTLSDAPSIGSRPVHPSALVSAERFASTSSPTSGPSSTAAQYAGVRPPYLSGGSFTDPSSRPTISQSTFQGSMAMPPNTMAPSGYFRPPASSLHGVPNIVSNSGAAQVLSGSLTEQSGNFAHPPSSLAYSTPSSFAAPSSSASESIEPSEVNHTSQSLRESSNSYVGSSQMPDSFQTLSSLPGQPGSFHGQTGAFSNHPGFHSSGHFPAASESKQGPTIPAHGFLQGPPSSIQGSVQKPSVYMQTPPGSTHGLPGVTQVAPSPIRGPSGSFQAPPSSVQGTPSSIQGPPGSFKGPPSSVQGPPSSIQGPPGSFKGPPSSVQGPPGSFQAPPSSVQGPPSSIQGPPGSFQGPPSSIQGPPGSFQGPPSSIQGPPGSFQGPPSSIQGPPGSFQGPPSSIQGPSGSFQGPPSSIQGPPGSFQGPPSSIQGPPGSFQRPPSSIQGPPGSFQRPPGSVQGPPGSPALMSGSQWSAQGVQPPLGPLQGLPISTQASEQFPQNLSASHQVTQESSFPPNPHNFQAGVPGHSIGFPQNSLSSPMPPFPPNPQVSSSGSTFSAPPLVGSPYPLSAPTSRPQYRPGVTSLPPSSFPSPQSMPPTSFPSSFQPTPTSFPPSQSFPGQQVRFMAPSSVPGFSPFPGPQMTPSSVTTSPPSSGMPTGLLRPGQSQVPGVASSSLLGQGSMPRPSQSQGMFPGPPQSQGFSSPGGPGVYPGRPQGQGMYPQQPAGAAQRRLDPDSLPSAVNVILDNQVNRGGEFSTGGRGVLPPAATTDFVCRDDGNANPRLLRSTIYNVPVNQDLIKSSHVPFALSISPFARLRDGEAPIPVVNTGELGPIRCGRCKAYICSFMPFLDGGRKFQCAFCGCATQVPEAYFNHLDHTGRRVDISMRPELYFGTFELTATKEYCRGNVLPSPPALIFIIDVSQPAIKSGMVRHLCANLQSQVLAHIAKEPGAEESELRVGFITYAKDINFYCIKSNLSRPQMLTLTEPSDIFVPLVEGFLVKPSESEAVIEALLTQIPSIFMETRAVDTALGPAVTVAMQSLRSAGVVGRLIVLTSSLPTLDVTGKLRNRDDRKMLGTDKEKLLLGPACPDYTKLAADCVEAGCGVDLFLFPNSYMDVATLGELCRMTGGQCYKYPCFQADLEGDRFISDLRENVSRSQGFDAIMRVRTSTGLRVTDYFGSFNMVNSSDVELASVHADASIAAQIKYDDKLSTDDGAFVQAAVLYTSVSGERRLRIINQSFSCCTQFQEMYRSVSLDTCLNFMAKKAVVDLLKSDAKSVRESVFKRATHILACYRRNCAQPTDLSQLILPEMMKLLPVYSNSLNKCDAFCGASQILTDDRSFILLYMLRMCVGASQVLIYPSLYPVTHLTSPVESPAPIRCSYQRLSDTEAYLLENGREMYLWIGQNVPTEWVNAVFGVQSLAQVDIEKSFLPKLQNPQSEALRSFVSLSNDRRHALMKFTVIRQHDNLESWFKRLLSEDQVQGVLHGYTECMYLLHQEISSILN